MQALRLHIAAQADCDPFDVSLPLLVEQLPHLLRARLNPVAWVLTFGKQQHILRPSSRYHVVAPSIPPEQLIPLPADLVLTRKARYVTYKPRPSYNKKKSASSQRPPPTKAS